MSYYDAIRKAEKTLKDIQTFNNKVIDEKRTVGEKCTALAGKIAGLSAGVQESTHGSQVGAPQCMSALATASQKCGRAVTLLTGHSTVFGKSLGGNVAGGSGSSSAANAIKVTPEIRRVQRSLELLHMKQAGIWLGLRAAYQYGKGGESDDLSVFSGKYDSGLSQIKALTFRMQTYANLLGTAYKLYHKEQEEAIARALRIPK